ncbi:MAG: hypothetical protein WAU60_14345 [Candidatus Competibacter denitrificans]|jgi:hypothetical protein
MNRQPPYSLLLLALWVGPTCAANKCVEINGRIFYQAAPCPPGAHGGDMSLNINRPVTGGVKQPILPPPMPLLPEDKPMAAAEPVEPETADGTADKPEPITLGDAASPPKKDSTPKKDQSDLNQSGREDEEQAAVHSPENRQ